MHKPAQEKTLLKQNIPELEKKEDINQRLNFLKIAECSLPPINPEKSLQNIMDCILPPKYLFVI